jgi:hypothetical protein
MMLVKILAFGSNWWARFGRDPSDRYRYTKHAAYFNSTGVRCGNKVRRHWILAGLVRFNGVGDFNPHYPNRAVGETFECTDLTFACGGNRVLFRRTVKECSVPDSYLVIVSSDRFGYFAFEHRAWKSDTVVPIAVSQLRDKQEAMLLMKPLGCVTSTLGTWELRLSTQARHGASLVLLEEHV